MASNATGLIRKRTGRDQLSAPVRPRLAKDKSGAVIAFRVGMSEISNLEAAATVAVREKHSCSGLKY